GAPTESAAGQRNLLERQRGPRQSASDDSRARRLPTPRTIAMSILDLRTYDEVMRVFSWSKLWELFDGDDARMNLAHECIDRHRHRGTAISVKFADGHGEHYDFSALSDDTGRFANWLRRRGIEKGDRVAVIVDPSRAFYVGLF